jgi:hypothetical protein
MHNNFLVVGCNGISNLLPVGMLGSMWMYQIKIRIGIMIYEIRVGGCSSRLAVAAISASLSVSCKDAATFSAPL